MIRRTAKLPIVSSKAKIITHTIIRIVNSPIPKDHALKPISAHFTSTVVLNIKHENRKIA
jgi:hypothetical protein